MKLLVTVLYSMFVLVLYSQTDSTNAKIEFSGFLEVYYIYDLSNPENNTRPDFFYSHNRHNEVNLNLAFIKASYSKNNIKANLALMTGTYANANLKQEPGVLKNIYEANIGVKISKKRNLLLEGGIFSSHIGFESAHSPSCWSLTRSILADNTPYYESGVKISYTNKNEKWFASGLLLNGWQRIQRLEGNSLPALGHQLTYRPNSGITLNSSSFIGTDTPDSVRCMRYFHNFYGQFQLHKNVGIVVGFDCGVQQKSKGSQNYYSWYSPVLLSKISLTNKTSLTLRGEYYSDENQVMITTGSLNGFQTIGYSLNFDYSVADNAIWRIEARGLQSKDRIFTLNDKPSNQNYFFSTSLALTF